MSMEEIEQLIQESATACAHEFLNQPQNIQRVRLQDKKLKQLEDAGMANPLQGRLLRALFIKNHIFACMHTSSDHPVYAENYELLLQGRQEDIRALVGDARLSLEAVRNSHMQDFAESEQNNDESGLHFAYSQAAGIQVALNSLADLRQKLAENFHDEDFLNKANDCQFDPNGLQPK